MGKLHERGQRLSARVTTNICRPDGIPYTATIDGNTLLVQKPSEAGKSTWRLNPHPDQLLLECIIGDSGTLSVAELVVAIEACFLTYPQHEQLKLDVSVADVNELMYLGLVLRDENKQMIVRAELSGNSQHHGCANRNRMDFRSPIRSVRVRGTLYGHPSRSASYTSATFPGSVLFILSHR